MTNYNNFLSFSPYKNPMLLIDKIIYIKKNVFIKSFKTIKKNDFFLKRHFFRNINLVYPGVLILEFLHQSSLMLIYKSEKFNSCKMFYLAKIKYAKFFFPIVYKDNLFGKVNIIKKILNMYIFDGKIIVRNKIACHSIFSCIIK
ncbi:3-hydroxyacyl-ACP dehydratase FabZ family protein [Buchnera aphidicola (Ceratovacuna keduensis)]|uniref:3-hydroxyacyl-ACP dehydratase FabZ family protein n=1 Tax=Buchnera aphidicola TaxID=9 RepID=UPI0031B83927